MKLLGSRIADFVFVSTNEIDLNMGLDLGLCKICDHITGGHRFLSLKGERILFIVEEGRVFIFLILEGREFFPK